MNYSLDAMAKLISQRYGKARVRVLKNSSRPAFADGHPSVTF
jgi:hypothetical protein